MHQRPMGTLAAQFCACCTMLSRRNVLFCTMAPDVGKSSTVLHTSRAQHVKSKQQLLEQHACSIRLTFGRFGTAKVMDT